MQAVVAIVGDIQNSVDARRIRVPEAFERMKQETLRVIRNEFALTESTTSLVSNGKAWCDHVAVALFLDHGFKQLDIHTPFPWKDGSFKCRGKAHAASMFHRVFSKTIGHSSLRDIDAALSMGAHLHSVASDDEAAHYPGCTHLIVLTLEERSCNFKGAARIAWQKAKHAHKHRICVPRLLAACNARLGDDDDESELCIEEQ
jgi:hypothetical protein